MTPLLFTCSWLLLPSSLLLTLSTGALEFYQDGVPENSEDVALRQLARYFETPEHQHRTLQRAHLSSLLGNPARKKHHLGLRKQTEQDLLEALAAKTSLADILSKEKLGEWNYRRQTQYNDPLNELPPEREFELPYYDLGTVNKPFEYPSLKLPYFVHKPNREDINFDGPQLPLRQEEPSMEHHPSFRGVDVGRGMKEEPMLEFHGSYHESIDANIPENNARKPHTPEFTFKFDDADISEEHPFAVRPNDPRYYRDSAFSPIPDNAEKSNANEEQDKGTSNEELDTLSENREAIKNDEESLDSAKHGQFKDGTDIALLEPDRQTGYQPVVVPVNHDLNNDIYFIAIVAGCSAAAMFALVLISLTWCRLQRGVKAAADIEYPAYGVTGPNKDVSPSGDQRLAQSAQMYHFQHQKQQIIAMENRTSATRDPGSVSEAESDEENEEGDYTVYECPGLASTGEMEVKNPLFHDDPTPATPAQTNKEEDHI